MARRIGAGNRFKGGPQDLPHVNALEGCLQHHSSPMSHRARPSIIVIAVVQILSEGKPARIVVNRTIARPLKMEDLSVYAPPVLARTRTGSNRSASPFKTEKMPTLIPMPSAIAITAATVRPGLRNNVRTPKRTS